MKRGHRPGRRKRVVTRRTVLKLAGAGAAAVFFSQLGAPPPSATVRDGLVMLTPREAALVEAIGARIWPGDASDPGAREAGTVRYIDRALGGALLGSLEPYRAALRQIDAAALRRSGHGFVELDDAAQDALLTRLSQGRLIGVRDGQRFFALIREHTLEGLFADPIHGGNRDLVGWKAVGYPGPFYLIRAEEQLSCEHELAYRSLADL